jgi:hypothetical protein
MSPYQAKAKEDGTDFITAADAASSLAGASNTK